MPGRHARLWMLTRVAAGSVAIGTAILLLHSNGGSGPKTAPYALSQAQAQQDAGESSAGSAGSGAPTAAGTTSASARSASATSASTTSAGDSPAGGVLTPPALQPQEQTAVPAGVTVVGAGQQVAQATPTKRVSTNAVPSASATATQSTVPNGAGPAPVSVPAYSDGCNHDYGVGGQCIPLVAPGGGPENCSSLTAAGYLGQPLVVHKDSLGLMAKKNVIMGETPDGKNMTVSACTD